VLAGAGLLTSAVLGGSVQKHLSSGGFQDPHATSTKAQDLLRSRFHAGDPNLVLLVTARHATVDDPTVAAAGAALTREVASAPGITQAVSYWSLGAPPPLRSADARQALVLARIGGSDDHVMKAAGVLVPRFTRSGPDVSVAAGGQAAVFRQVSTTIRSDLARAESIAVPITLVLLVLVFGSAVAASLPLAVGGLAVLGTFLVLRLLTLLTPVSIFSLNLTTALGLGLAIDYSLFIVSRFREELRAGLEPNAAVARTLHTAGRTVLFSAFTVAVSLAALLVFPLYFLRSFAYAGIAVVMVAAVGAVVVLPALLAALGRNVGRWSLRRRPVPADGEGFWHGLATAVMRRPLPIILGVVGLLLLLGTPFLRVQFGLPDDRVLPAGASTHVVSDQIRRGFASREAAAISVVAPTASASPGRGAEISRYAATLSSLPGAARVDAVTGSWIAGRPVLPPGRASARFVAAHGTWLSVVPAVEPLSPGGERLVRSVRATASPFPVLVGGQSAELVDSKATLFRLVPVAGGIIAMVTFTLLFLAFGSVVVPVKAIVLNLLSLTATFGAMVWIFQTGHLAGLLHFTPTGVLNTSMPILMFCIAFGLSMDYEVFLLSRIKEEHDSSRDNVRSVALGLERSGRIVTAAAVLLAVIFVSFATSGISFIKMFGIGLTMAVVMDATLIRGALVPAFMRLAGEANWWAPAPLRRLRERWAIDESGAAEALGS
jgi:RND superfamily putative drug exporter